MPTLRLRFPGGRYHATPWGHHVNEGLVEWPPCPWRLLRALIACGFASQAWTEIPVLAQGLIGKLAGVLPSYRLPEASLAHSRHFMPVGSLSKGREQTTLVFDTWANVGDGEFVIHWPCELTGEETALLGQLASSLGYLGRSESWVEAELAEDGVVEWNAQPSMNGEHRGYGWEQISLMAAIPSNEYESWRSAQVEAALRPFEGQKKTAAVKKKQDNAIAPYPADLVTCLTKDTAWWKAHGWSQPPGTRRVLYWRRSDALQVGVPRGARTRSVKPVTMMLLAMTTPTGNRSPLPPCSRTLPQAELFHRAVVGLAAKGEQEYCPELTGKTADRKPLQNGHAHAHVLPVALGGNGDGRLDHLIIHAPMGLGKAAQRAIRSLRRTWAKGSVGELQLAVVGSGDLDCLRKLRDPLGRRMEGLLGPRQGATVWQSVTPFVPPRFIKRRGRNTLIGQINAELESRGLPPVDQVEIQVDRTRSLRHYVRRRGRGAIQPFNDSGYGLRLVFARPINGLLTLGYASHYGLGLFEAVLD